MYISSLAFLIVWCSYIKNVISTAQFTYVRSCLWTNRSRDLIANLGNQFLLLVLPFIDFILNLCLNNCMKPWVWFITEECLKSLKQSKQAAQYYTSQLQKLQRITTIKLKSQQTLPPAAQRREPLKRLEQDCPAMLVLVSAG